MANLSFLLPLVNKRHCAHYPYLQIIVRISACCRQTNVCIRAKISKLARFNGGNQHRRCNPSVELKCMQWRGIFC
ncbi:hypothetical protein BRADI_2g03925v3 [Brachypodium distachyon]|uniref:Uncharacterized protein n=1 Tax=Brachypodium distachyon TaxID=15368 RepID=A0A2K2D6R0_BRADI|nr:hypothetical protein BRADI_2g03925v3 [Brachypodium distachyon]